MNDTAPTAAITIIGNEILSGRTQDSNINYIAQKLTDAGIRLLEVRVIPDVEEDIVATVNALRDKYTYVFTTGGIGPTHDDITADSVAKAFGVGISEHQEARQLLGAHYPPGHLTPARLRMARIPDGATLIYNPVSAAPGFRLGNVHVLAGVPNIMQAMLDGILSGLRHGPKILSKTVSGYVAESIIADELGDVAQRFPQLDIGSYPWVRNARFGTALVVRGTDAAAIQQAADAIYQFVQKRDPEAVVE